MFATEQVVEQLGQVVAPDRGLFQDCEGCRAVREADRDQAHV
jgi:hypothetical protein